MGAGRYVRLHRHAGVYRPSRATLARCEARREGLSPEDLEYGWETVLVLGLVWSAALLWFATLLE